MSGPCADASDPNAVAGAERAFQAGGNSVDAVLAGFFYAAGHSPAVLFSPVVAMVAGVGTTPRLIDGRCVQAGLGLKRPRGFRPEDSVPPEARAAVPRSLAALALLHAYGAKRTWSAALTPAAPVAKKASAPKRAELLRLIAKSGAAALTKSSVTRALLTATGPSAGGLMSERDLQEVRAQDERIDAVTVGKTRVSAIGQLAGAGDAPRRCHVVVAADPNGLLCALAYSPDPDALEVPELEVSLTADGVPVRRGVPRTTPQTPLAAAAPLAIVQRPNDGWNAVIGSCQSEPLATALLGGPQSLHQIVTTLQPQTGYAMAASVERRKTQVTRVG